MTTAMDPAVLAAITQAVMAQQAAAATAYAPVSAVAPGTTATQPGYPAAALPPAPVVLPTIASMDEFFNQKTGGGGKGWTFKDKPNGTSYWGIVEREVGKGDIEAVTNPTNGQVQSRKDGSVKWQMKVPMLMVPIPNHDDGHGQAYIKGDSQAKLTAAMRAVGAPDGPPEPGAFLQITKIGERPIKGFSPQYLYEVVYRRPGDTWTVAKTAEVTAAHEAIAAGTAPAALTPPGPGASAADFMAYAQALQAQASAAATPVVVPPPTAPAAAPAAPPVMPPAAGTTPAIDPAALAAAMAAAAAPAPVAAEAAPTAPAGVDMSQLDGLPDAARELFLRLTQGQAAPAPVG
jgi:hypothetical protein